MKVNIVRDIELYDPILNPIEVELDKREHDIVYSEMTEADGNDIDFSIVVQDQRLKPYKRTAFYVPHGVSCTKHWYATMKTKYFVCPSYFWADEINYVKEFKATKVNPDIIPLTGIGWSKMDYWRQQMRQERAIRYDICDKLGFEIDEPLVVYSSTWKAGISHGYSRKGHLSDVEKELRSFNLITTKHQLDKTMETADTYYRSDGFKFVDLMIASDLLITDTGSIAYEYCMLDRPIVLLDRQDIPGYLRLHTYTSRETLDCGEHATIDNLRSVVAEELCDNSRLADRRRYWLDRIVGPTDGLCSQRLVSFMETLKD